MRYPARGRPARAAHAVHLEPGRLRRRLPVLRHRRARLRARPRDGRDRRPGPRLAAGAWPADGRRLTNVVFMGMGEPLLNLDRVLEAVDGAHRPARGSGWARATSRSAPAGVVPGIERLTALGPQFTLAVSLHAARDRAARRARAAQPALAGRRGRRRGPRLRRGDRPPGHLRVRHDRRHQRHRRRRRRRWPTCCAATSAHVNLIPMNPVAHTPWQASPMPSASRRFADAPPARRARHARSAATGAWRSARPAASWRPSGPASRRRRPSPAAASCSSPRARPRCAASGAAEPRSPGSARAA